MSVHVLDTAAWCSDKDGALPEELAEGLVVGDGFVVVLGEAVLDVLEAPLLHQLAGGLGLLGRGRQGFRLVGGSRG